MFFCMPRNALVAPRVGYARSFANARPRSAGTDKPPSSKSSANIAPVYPHFNIGVNATRMCKLRRVLGEAAVAHLAVLEEVSDDVKGRFHVGA